MPTREEERERIYRQVKADYEAVKGEIIQVRELSGYIDDNSVDFNLKTPALVRVVRTSDDELFHQVDDWVDPYWNLEVLVEHPELENARSFWMFGTSYNLRTGEVERARFWPSRKEWRPRRG